MIGYVNHDEIDRQRWDNCVVRSSNPLPYALSWWLDAVCPEWEAMVEDDYVAVMPLTPGHKYGIHYLYQPFFTQQLGVFSNPGPSPEMVNAFLSAIPLKYRYLQIQLNTGNPVVAGDFDLTYRKNHLIDLSPSATELAGNYHRNCRRNIQKAVHAGLQVKTGPEPAVFTRFIRQHLDEKLTDTRKSLYSSLLRITQASIRNGAGEIHGVYCRSGELLAAGWFITGMGRCLFQVCASTPKGKENQAMFLLVDTMIRKNARSGLVFDFAGSNAKGIAYFNEGFGARETLYPALHRNKLAWPLRLIKR
jgi:hypothetical protein